MVDKKILKIYNLYGKWKKKYIYLQVLKLFEVMLSLTITYFFSTIISDVLRGNVENRYKIFIFLSK